MFPSVQSLTPIALRTAKTLLSFGRSESNRVNIHRNLLWTTKTLVLLRGYKTDFLMTRLVKWRMSQRKQMLPF